MVLGELSEVTNADVAPFAPIVGADVHDAR
jgi:hypothetical protein